MVRSLPACAAMLAIVVMLARADGGATGPASSSRVYISYLRDRAVWARPVAPDGLERQVTDRGSASSVDWTGDGHWLAYIAAGDWTRLCVREGRAGGTVRSLPFPGQIWWHSWSPDGALLAVGYTYWETAGERVCAVARIPWPQGPAQEPLYDCRSAPREGLLATEDPGGRLAWSADSRRLAWATGWSGIWECGPAREAPRPLVAQGAACDPSFSPDGSAVAFAAPDSSGWGVWVARRGAAAVRLTREGAEERGPSWNPDGTLLAVLQSRVVSKARVGPLPPGVLSVYAMDERSYDVCTVAGDGSAARSLTRGRMDLLDEPPTWLPDGRSVMFRAVREAAEGRGISVYIADLATGDVRAAADCVVPGPHGVATYPECSPHLSWFWDDGPRSER